MLILTAEYAAGVTALKKTQVDQNQLQAAKYKLFCKVNIHVFVA